MSQVIISIIVPVYNRGYCLRRCLDSVKEQSFTDWECLLIDDGSTDDTYGICKEYAMDDDRFQTYHQENRGVSAARNKGLDMAKGIYVNFVDSDDYLDKNYLLKLHDVIGDCDLSICGFTVFKDTGKLSYFKSHPAKTFLVEPDNGKEFIQFYKRGLLYGPVCKLYIRSVIEANAVRFRNEMSFGEDVIFNYDYLLYVKSFHVIPDRLYNVTQTAGSLVASPHKQSFRNHMLCWEVAARFYEARRMCGEYVRNDLNNIYMETVWLGLYMIVLMHATLSATDRYTYLKKILGEVDWGYVEENCGFSKWKIFLMKHGLLLWFLSEVKYGVMKIKGIKI